MFKFIEYIFRNLLSLDGLIIGIAILNGYWFYKCKKQTDIIYNHFNSQDKIRNLNEEQKKAVMTITEPSEERRLSPEELLNAREEMNKDYALVTSVTTAFPLLGMLGTVISLLNMSELIGTEATGIFLSALTSTFWGIVFAIAYKGLDATISYKIEDNEKHMDYLFNPTKKQVLNEKA